MARLLCVMALLPAAIGCASSERDGNSPGGDQSRAAGKGDVESAIRIEFDQPSYSFTLAEVARGVTIRYRVTVLRELDGMHPQSQTTGTWQGQADLLPFAWIQGNGQQYRPWDFGLGPAPAMKPVTITKGARDYRLDWDGRNWQGPSDTSNPKGPPFPPGRYTITVRIMGQQDTPEGKKPYEIKQTAPLILTQ